MDKLQGLLEFGADPFIMKKQNFHDLGVFAKRCHYQRMGPPPSAFSQFMNVDSLQGLLEFGADSFVLRKTNFPWFGCDCKKAPSPNDRSTATHIQHVDERGQAARPSGVWG